METKVILKCLVFDDGGRVLLIRRSATDDRRPNQWDIPGGKHEPDETLDAGLAREVKEETGLELTSYNLVHAVNRIMTWMQSGAEVTNNSVWLFFVGKTNQPNDSVVLSEEHSEYKWVDIDEASELFDYGLHKDFIKHVRINKLEL